MRFKTIVLLLLFLLIMSCILTSLAVALNKHILTLFSTLLFLIPILLLSVGYETFLQNKENLNLKDTYSFSTMSKNTLLTALVYGWGSSTLIIIYTFAGVTWLHGVQYGLASGLIAILLSIYWYYAAWETIYVPSRRILVVIHGVFLATGVSYLISSGKLMTKRGDWAANYIFLTGGITLLTICLVTFLMQKKITIEK